MTTTPTHPRHRKNEKPGVCRRCNGPCRTYKGAVHAWTCEACLDAYLAKQAAR